MNRNGFDIGEYVSYGINGMCNIEDIRPMQLSQTLRLSVTKKGASKDCRITARC